jgi:hypothetical protein
MPAQNIIFEVRIDFRRHYFLVSESGLNRKSRRAEFEQIGGESMPQIVKAKAFDTSIFRRGSPGRLKISEPVFRLFVEK